MVPISDLLSQYGILDMLCTSLSSADVIHLAATSKAHWTYIASNDKIRKRLIEGGTCDGGGIVARARCFLHWGGDETRADYSCLGRDAKPCTDCGALVCDNCRFRFFHGEPLNEFSEEDERNYTFHIDKNCVPEDLDDLAERRAHDLWYNRGQVVCHDCHPLLDLDNEKTSLCDCEMYDHFVGQRRLCMPCFFVEETSVIEANAARTRYGWTYTDRGRVWRRRPHCDCGKEAIWETQVCRDCGRFRQWPTVVDSRNEILSKILAQLGGSKEQTKYDPDLLAQLG